MVEKRKCIDNQNPSVVPILPLTSWVTLGKLLISLLQFHKMRITELKGTLEAIESKPLILQMRKLR